nr:transposase [Pantoea vagans]
MPEVCRKLGISEATFYTWRNEYGGISPSELKHMRQLEEENLRLSTTVHCGCVSVRSQKPGCIADTAG